MIEYAIPYPLFVIFVLLGSLPPRSLALGLCGAVWCVNPVQGQRRPQHQSKINMSHGTAGHNWTRATALDDRGVGWPPWVLEDPKVGMAYSIPTYPSGEVRKLPCIH